ncbi:MAG TPA: biotin synthase BioB, partial [Nocardioides sp.]|nr:biotin synthase BioB [Nocardioides sp.]
AGGREMHLRSLQALALQVANSIFLGDYLTSEGQDALTDLEMLRDNGFIILGMDESAFDELIAAHRAGVVHRAHAAGACGSEGCGDGCGGSCGSHAEEKPAIRRRGAGTEVAANA